MLTGVRTAVPSAIPSHHSTSAVYEIAISQLKSCCPNASLSISGVRKRRRLFEMENIPTFTRYLDLSAVLGI
jgi:hypothetical protein